MMKNSVEGRASEVNKEIDTFFDEQVKVLNYYRANIKHEVSTQGQIRVSKLKNQAELLSSFLAQLKSGISFTDEALQDGDDVKLLAMKKQLVQQLDQLNSSNTSCKPCMDDYLELQVHQTIWDMGKILSVCYVPFDPQKCTVSMVGGNEGVMYQTLAGQEVELLLLVKDDKGKKKTCRGHQVEAIFSFSIEPGLKSANSPVPVHDNGDGSYSFSYHPVEEGKVNLSVRVEKQEVCGSPFGWKVISKLPGGESSPKRKEYSQTIPLVQSAFGISVRPSLFTEGMYCWKLQLTSFKGEIDSELEIGVTRRQRQLAKWSWGYSTDTMSSQASRSDGQIPSITSVQDNDVFIVFLNLERKKLTIYNVRSKQTEIFTGIAGYVSSSFIRSESPVAWEEEEVWGEPCPVLAFQ